MLGASLIMTFHCKNLWWLPTAFRLKSKFGIPNSWWSDPHLSVCPPSLPHIILTPIILTFSFITWHSSHFPISYLCLWYSCHWNVSLPSSAWHTFTFYWRLRLGMASYLIPLLPSSEVPIALGPVPVSRCAYCNPTNSDSTLKLTPYMPVYLQDCEFWRMVWGLIYPWASWEFLFFFLAFSSVPDAQNKLNKCLLNEFRKSIGSL